jgi:hypothetical protein
MPRHVVIGAVDQKEQLRNQLVVCRAASPA